MQCVGNVALYPIQRESGAFDVRHTAASEQLEKWGEQLSVGY